VSELVVRGLAKAFGDVPVLRGLDLTVPEHSLTAVLGPSGCGKTTLLRLVAGFGAPDAGEISVGGKRVSWAGGGLPPEQRRIGIVPQEGALFPHLSVGANVGFGLKGGRSGARGRNGSRVESLLELVGLGGYARRMPHELSGGQQQRVALARALAPEPALVLLDEPFSALDTGLRATVREDVRTALRVAGATAVLVTHDQQEALSMADLVAVMREGRVAQLASPADLYGAPADVGVATFVGEAVLLAAVLRGDRAECALGSLPVRFAGNGSGGNGSVGRGAGDAGTVMVRPEQVVLGPVTTGVPGRVRGLSFFGHDALVRVEVAGPGEAAVEVVARTQGAPEVDDDDKVGVRVLGEVSFFPAP
jgi:iron(III) transport system ATP-binding protein